MRKRKLFTVALAALLTAGCQVKEIADPPSPASAAAPTSQSVMLEEKDSFGASETGNGESAPPPEQAPEQVLRNAQALTRHLVNRVFHKEIVERGESITDRELFYFFTTLPAYMQDKDHPYCDAVTATPELLYIFPADTVRQIARELFGFENWAFDDSMMDYNADAGQYESGLEFGTGANQYRCSDLQAVYLEAFGAIDVTFALEGVATVDGDPGWEHLGRYSMRYGVVGESSIFLRYENIQRVA